MTTIRGEAITHLGTSYITNKDGTGTTTERYSGIEAEIIVKAQELQSLHYGTEITYDGTPFWKLNATLNIDLATNPDEEEPEPQTKWSLTPNQFEQSIFECNRPFVSGLPSSVRTRIETKLKNPQKFSLSFIDFATSEFDDYTLEEMYDLQNRAARVYHYKQMGCNGRQEYTLTLQRTINVSTRYNANWSVANVGKVLSTGAVINSADVDTQTANLMPNSGYANETVYVDGYFAANAGEMVIPFYYGWLEKNPTRNVVGDNAEISQTWTFNKWLVGSDGMYDVIE